MSPRQSIAFHWLVHHSHIEGGHRLSDFPSGKDRGNGLWGKGMGELGSVLGRWFGLETMGGAVWVLAVNGLSTGVGAGFKREVWGRGKNGPSLFILLDCCNWARIGPSKSSQSLSNAHKGLLKFD
ncbi:hypothetical protein Tco_1474326 [Tanacetum coccineum]